MVQISDPAVLLPIIHDVFAKNEQSVADYRGGKQNAAKALVGQLMKATKGQANPTVAQNFCIKNWIISKDQLYETAILHFIRS